VRGGGGPPTRLSLLLRDPFEAFVANIAALSITATANIESHRTVTFRSRPSERSRRVIAVVATVLYDATYSSTALGCSSWSSAIPPRPSRPW